MTFATHTSHSACSYPAFNNSKQLISLFAFFHVSNLALSWTESPEDCSGNRKWCCCFETLRFQGQMTVICPELWFSTDGRLCSSEHSAWGRMILRALCSFLKASSALCSPLAAFTITQGCQVPTTIFPCKEAGLELWLDVHILLFLCCSSYLVNCCAKGACNRIAASKTILLDEGSFEFCFVFFFSPNFFISAR